MAAWLFFFTFELAALKVFAQMVGSRDLTSGWRVPLERISVPQTCEKPRSDPDDKSSYLSLEPGNWLEIKLHARVECGLENCMGEIQPDNKAVLTAWWYQRVLTHRVSGCDETHGSFTVRELDSAPFTVTVKSPSAKTSAVVWNH
jgi:hypothetical protein